MELYYILIACFVASGTLLGIYTSTRRYYLTQQIKRSGRIISMTPILSSLITARTQDRRRMWVSPVTGLPPPPAYNSQYVPPPPPYSLETIQMEPQQPTLSEPPPYRQ